MNSKDLEDQFLSETRKKLEDFKRRIEQRTKNDSLYNEPFSLGIASEKMKAKIASESNLDYQMLSSLSGVSYGTVNNVLKDPASGRVSSLVKMLEVLDMELVIREK